MNTTALDPALSLRQAPAWLRSVGYGYLYWLVFLLVLEPGNVLRASRSYREALRKRCP
jgi:hypothetical protein